MRTPQEAGDRSCSPVHACTVAINGRRAQSGQRLTNGYLLATRRLIHELLQLRRHKLSARGWEGRARTDVTRCGSIARSDGIAACREGRQAEGDLSPQLEQVLVGELLGDVIRDLPEHLMSGAIRRPQVGEGGNQTSLGDLPEHRDAREHDEGRKRGQDDAVRIILPLVQLVTVPDEAIRGNQRPPTRPGSSGSVGVHWTAWVQSFAYSQHGCMCHQMPSDAMTYGFVHCTA